MDELKPCPFCGDAGKINHRQVNDDYIPECSNNNCIASYMIGNCFITQEEAVKAWNTRVEH